MPNNAEWTAVITGIDPGTEMLGVADIYFNVKTFEIVSVNSTTYIGSKLNMDRWLAEIHNARFSRLRAHKENLAAHFMRVNSSCVVCESPFFNPRRPNAFEALVETVMTIRQAIWEYDLNLPLFQIDPPSVKKAVGAKGGADKDSVKNRILSIDELRLKFFGPVLLHMLDDHSIDAIAVAYSKFVEFRGMTKC